jgi:excisionase family DNA binding protein
LKYTLERKINELNYRKLKREFSFTLRTYDNDGMHNYSMQEVAKLLGRTLATVKAYIKSGNLSAYETFNKDLRITRDELELFLNNLRNSRKLI